MLKDKITIVTGGAMGIGGSVARKFAQYGAKVLIVDFNEAEAEKNTNVIKAAGGIAEWIKADVTDYVQCEQAVERCVEVFGGLDILANCAGISSACKIADMTDAIWDRTLNVNLKGTMYMNKACLKVMKEAKAGRIINIASISGKTPEDMNGAYCVSKAGVMMLTQCVALENAEFGITANAVCPGPTNTAIMEQVFRERSKIEGITPEQFEKKFLSDIPLKRMAESDDIGELMCFLASDRAAYITGQCITIAGGKIWN